MNLPEKAGFYWAKTSGTKWFNAIIQVYGESPFFKVNGFDYRSDKRITDISEINEFGDKIKNNE